MLFQAQKNKNALLNYGKFIINCDKIKNSPVVSLKSLQRVLQLNCKTSLLNNKILFFRLKGSEFGIRITYNINPIFPAHYFSVYSSAFPKFIFEISAITTKELMYKINHVYKLTNKL